MNNRIKFVQIILLISFIPIFISLYYLQVYKGGYYRKKSLENVLRVIPYPASRGMIIDCNGMKLVDNFSSFQIAVIPQEITDLEYVLSRISRQFSVPISKLQTQYDKNYRYPFVPVTILEHIPKLKAIDFEAQNSLNGVIVRVWPERKYLYGKVASHLIGFLGKIDSSQLKRFKKYGYSATDYIGKSGIEEYFDSYLRGTAGGALVEVDSKGRQVKLLGLKNPHKGKDIRLTVDIKFQKFIDNLLADKKGAIIVMEPDTGYIRALVSKPNFDPNVFLNYKENLKIIRQLLHSPDGPLFNRAISGVYMPGSIFKISVSAAGLESKIIELNDRFVCKGYTEIGPRKFRCWYEKGHGGINLIQALQYSCNVYFYKLGLQLGVNRLYEYAKKFRLGMRTDIELLGEAEGVIPNEIYKKKKFGAKWYSGDTANFSIGQGYVRITPIQALSMLSGVATRGFIPKPKLVKRIQNIDISSPELECISISSNTLENIHKALIQVVESPYGTGRLANVEEMTIAGKTGTAQFKSKKPHAWFVGYAPAKKPKVCLVIILEHGGQGGIQAAKIAKKIFEYYKYINFPTCSLEINNTYE